jgi:hypothetical protein
MESSLQATSTQMKRSLSAPPKTPLAEMENNAIKLRIKNPRALQSVADQRVVDFSAADRAKTTGYQGRMKYE